MINDLTVEQRKYLNGLANMPSVGTAHGKGHKLNVFSNCKLVATLRDKNQIAYLDAVLSYLFLEELAKANA